MKKHNTLKTIAEIRSGYSFRTSVKHDPQGDITAIQLKDVENGNINTGALARVKIPRIKKNDLIQKGEILIKSRGMRSSIGEVALVASPIENAVASNHFLVVRIKSSLVLPEYLLWFLKQKPAQKFLFARAEGTSLNQIKKRDLEGMTIWVPPKHVQNNIAEIDRLRIHERELLEKLIVSRQRFIDAALLEYAETNLT